MVKNPKPTSAGVLTATILLVAVGIVGLGIYFHRAGYAGGKNAGAFAATNSVAETIASSPAPAADLRAAVLAAFREANPTRRSLAFGTSFAAWFAQDPETALAWLRAMPAGSEYNQGMFIALQAIGRTDPARSLALAADMAVTHEQKYVYNALFACFASNDLASAVNWLQNVPVGEARENALHTVTDQWTARDPAGAFDWAKNLEAPGERSAAVESILTALAAADPRQAVALASQNLTGGAQDRVLEKSLNLLAATDPRTAADLVASLPEGELQNHTALAVARALAGQDPSSALSWVQTLPPGAQPAALNNTLDVWLKQNPADAGNFVAGMSAGSAQDNAASHLAEDWAANDSAAAIAWAENLASDTARDAALISLASGWARTDPAAAVRWTAGLPAEQPARLAALRGAYSYWELADPSAARNYLGTLPVSDRQALQPGSLASK